MDQKDMIAQIEKERKEFESKFLKEYSSKIGKELQETLHNEEKLKNVLKGYGDTLKTIGVVIPSVYGATVFHELGHLIGCLSATGWQVGGNISADFIGGQFRFDFKKLGEYVRANPGSLNGIELSSALSGPLFDVISSLSLLLVASLLKRKNKLFSKLFLASTVGICAQQLVYMNMGKDSVSALIHDDYFNIAEHLSRNAGQINEMNSIVTGLFAMIFSVIIGLAIVTAFYPNKLEKEIKDYIKSLGVKTESGKQVKEVTVWEKWKKDYDAQIVNYALSHFFKSDLSKLQKYEQKQYSADSIKYFDRIHDEKEVYSQLCASVFGLSAISKDYAVEFAPVKLFYEGFTKISPLKEAYDNLSKIAKKLTAIFEDMYLLKQDNGVIGIINQMRTDVCNQYMKNKYRIELPSEKKTNNLMLEILAAREMEKAYSISYGENNENTIKIKQRLMELLKEDTKISILFSALLDVYFNKEYFRDYKMYGFVTESRIKNANHLIDDANKILENLPKRIKEFFVKKPEVLKELKQRANELKIPDVDFENIKLIPKINRMTKFDYLVILDATKNDNFNDDQMIPKYSKILADALVKKTNDDYFEDPEKISRMYEVDYNKLKKMWEETINANIKFVTRLNDITSSSILEAGKELVQKAKKINTPQEKIETIKQLISAAV